MTIDIGVFLPTSTPDPEQPIVGDIRASARFAEEVGLDSIWTADHLVASAPLLDSTVVVAAAVAVTERITVGFNVMVLDLHPVAWVAKQIGALQHLSGDRLVVGVGTGNPAHGDIAWRALGLSYADRGPRTDEALRVLPGLVSGQATVLPNGVQVTLVPGSTMPPVLVAGNGNAALRRAAAYGDGWVCMALAPDALAAQVSKLGELAARYGRPAPKATVVAPILDADPQRAIAQIFAYAEAGAQRLILAPAGPDWRRDYDAVGQLRAAL